MTGDKASNRKSQQECKNYLLLYSAFTFTLGCSIFPIQTLGVCSMWDKCSKCKWVFSVMQATLKTLCNLLELKSLSIHFLLNLFGNLNICLSSQYKTIFFSFVQWNKYFIWRKMKCSIQCGFASLNRKFYISPHEVFCTITLINIDHFYNISLFWSILVVHWTTTLCFSIQTLIVYIPSTTTCSIFEVTSSGTVSLCWL